VRSGLRPLGTPADNAAVTDAAGSQARFQDLFERASRAATDEECQRCMAEIEQLLESARLPSDRAWLLMCRARVRSNQWRTAAVFEDTRAAMSLFELAGETDLAASAASWAAAHASRMGELTEASELATKSLLSLESVTDDRLRAEILNRLGIFSNSFLDYDRAIELMEASLAAAERVGDQELISRQLHNIADSLLLADRQRQLAHLPSEPSDLERAEALVRRLLSTATDEFNRRTASHRLLAEVLCERGHAQEALAVLEQYRDRAGDIAAAAQRAALAWIEARCLRLTGQPARALVEAERAVGIAQASDDAHELMVAFEELAACQEALGDSTAALATAREVKALMWTIHQRQTRQVVQEVWARADLVRHQARLQSEAAKASRRAEEDALTGVGNRRTLIRFVNDRAHAHNRLALILIDIDRFKDVNDTFGHQTGDAVLRRIGHLLRDEMRAHQVVVRYGGDEFVIALLGVDLPAAAGFAERLRREFEELDLSTLASGLRVTASQGVASGARRRWRSVLAAADTALYAAKRAGRNVVVTAPAPRRTSRGNQAGQARASSSEGDGDFDLA
jgi:diguanylate cyclase (GGDEF)-like protein